MTEETTRFGPFRRKDGRKLTFHFEFGYHLPALTISERRAGISELRNVRLVVHDLLGREASDFVGTKKMLLIRQDHIVEGFEPYTPKPGKTSL